MSAETTIYFSHTLTAYQWSAPDISPYEAQRYNTVTGQKDENGTYIRARATFTYSPMNGLVPVSSTFAWRIKGGAWSAEAPFTSGAWTAALGGGTVTKTQEYEIRFTVTDPRGTVITATALITQTGYAYRRYFNGTAWTPWVLGGF